MSESSEGRNPIEVLAEDFLDRYRRGERPSVTEYTQRHPEIADDIRGLLPALLVMEDVRPPENESGVPNSSVSSEIQRLTQLGDFRIIREVGRGGMGIVYEAEQVSLGRRVALKLLPKQSLLDSKHQQRFLREAKAAARLHHTNIVPVFGVGQQDGLHYYVMQFIHGLGLDEVLVELQRLRDDSQASGGRQPTVPTPVAVSAAAAAQSLLSGHFARTLVVDDESDQASAVSSQPTTHTTLNTQHSTGGHTDTVVGQLSDTFPGHSVHTSKHHSRQVYWQSVARIGLQSAQALQYAHDQGIIHRDVKPGNLLLDTRGSVWVTDFGLAKAADQQDLTNSGDVLGTLRYMAPEQFEGKADARSDVFSLGLTLYELLGLQPAFGERDRHKLIKQVTTGTPPRLRTLDPNIPRDLETIVHKAIDRDPSHRYQTAGELAADLQRYLGDEPIRARWISPITRFHRWCRRNPLVAGLTSTIAVLVIATAIGSSIAMSMFWDQSNENAQLAEAARASKRTANEEADKARTEAAISQAVNDFLNNDLLGMADAKSQSEADFSPDPDIKLRTVLDRAADRLDSQFVDQPRVEANLRFTLGDTYRSIGEYTRAEEQFERVLELWRAEAGDDHPNALTASGNLANLYTFQGEYAKAEDLLRRSLDILRRTLGDDHMRTLQCIKALAANCYQQHRFVEAEDLYLEALETERETLGETDPHVMQLESCLAELYYSDDRLGEAEALIQELLEKYEETYPADHPEIISANCLLGLTYLKRGRFLESEMLLRATLQVQQHTLGESHEKTLHTQHSLACCLNLQGKLEEAEMHFRTAHDLQREVLGADHPSTLASLAGLGHVMINQKRYSEAEELLRTVYEARQRVRGPEHPQTLESALDLGAVYKGQQRYLESEKLFKETLSIQQRTLGDQHLQTLRTRRELALLYFELERFAEAEPLFRNAWQGRRSALGDTHADALLSLYNLSVTLRRLNRHEEAEGFARKLVDLRRQVHGEEHRETLLAMKVLRGALSAQDRHNEAEKLCSHTCEIAARILDEEDQLRQDLETDYAAFSMKRAWGLAISPDSKQGNAAEALRLTEIAVTYKPNAADVRQVLGWALYRNGLYERAIDALETSIELQGDGGDEHQWFFLAMAHWQLGNEEAAREWYQQGVDKMVRRGDEHSERIALRDEAGNLIGAQESNDVDGEDASPPPPAPVQSPVVNDEQGEEMN